MWYGLGIFLEFHYLSVNIPFYVTLICDIVKVLFPIPIDVDNLLNHVKSVFFSFFSNFLLEIVAQKSTTIVDSFRWCLVF